MRLPLYQIDAFTNRLFAGNPAAVCPLPRWLPDEYLQSIAAENNLAETAFFVQENDAYRLRWFTPTIEMDLCGHATLAAAFVIMNCLSEGIAEVRFLSKSGELIVRRDRDLYALDFPARPPLRVDAHPKLLDALGAVPADVLAARDYLVVYNSEAEVRALRPNMDMLMAVDRAAVIVTAPGKDADFVSRFFAPKLGVPEDPVTGSAHCTLIPYWSARLGKTSLHARQVSKRGGELWCELQGDRVKMAGNGVLYLEGSIEIPD